MDGAWHWVSCLEKKPEKRREEDLDIIYCKLKSMPVFENYPDKVLQELNRYALYDSFLANITRKCSFAQACPGVPRCAELCMLTIAQYSEACDCQCVNEKFLAVKQFLPSSLCSLYHIWSFT